MFLKSVFYAAGTIAVAFGGYAVLTQAAPGAAGKVDALVRDYALGWSDEACSSNPLGCLNNRFGKLKELEKQVTISIRAIRAQVERTSALVREQQSLANRNASFLAEGKQLYIQKASASDGPIYFAGKNYPNLGLFKQQLALLFQEKKGLDTSLSGAKGLEKKLDDRLNDLMVQAGNITLAKRMVPAQIELVRANTVLADFGGNIDMINGVIKGSEAGIAETEQLIRTTKDLMGPTAESGAVPQVSNKEFEDFLAQ